MKFVSFTLGAGSSVGSQIAVSSAHIVSYCFDAEHGMVRLETATGPMHVKDQLGDVIQWLDEATAPPAQPDQAIIARR